MATERKSVEHPSRGSKKTRRPRSALRRVGRLTGKTALRVAAALGILILLLIVASFFFDEPMRRSMESRMNRSLKGYTVTLPKAHFSLFGLSVTLHDLSVRQQANPDPPVIVIPKLKASVQWRELLSFHLVADFLVDRPSLHINLIQLRHENQDETPVKDKGWQDAVEQIYPLKINLLRVNDGDVVYIDENPKAALHISHLKLRANNIRNIHSRENVYPSPIHAEGVIFETGRGMIDGHADFLAKPFPGIHTLFQLEKVPLDALRPMIARANLSLKGGVLATRGRIEYSAKKKFVQVADLTIRGLRLDYIHTAATAAAESARKQKLQKAAKEATNRPDMTLRVDRLELADADIGLVNKAKDPSYRVFLSNANLVVTNLSNQFGQGPAKARLSGRFLGSGPTKATATFRPEKNGPDFDLNVEIQDTDMTKMNDLLRAYGKFDVVAGVFSFYSELKVKNGRIEGYVKPLFRDMDVYDKRQDKDKSIFKKLYEGLVGGVSKLLENTPRNEVVTKADISGPVGNARANTWEVIVKLIQNAFFRAILPGFNQGLPTPKKK